MIDNEPYWTLAEAVVWICTRDFARVSSVGDIRSDAALAEETYKLLSEITRTVVDPPDLNEIREGVPKASWNVSGTADNQIIERARDGSVRAIGRRTWDGPLERIPPAEFMSLRIYAIPDRLQRGQSIAWLDVQFARADVMRQWPEELLALWPSDLATTPAPEGQDGEDGEPTVEPDHPIEEPLPAPADGGENGPMTRKKPREKEHDQWIKTAKELALAAKKKKEKLNVSAIARTIAKQGNGKLGDPLDTETVRRYLYERTNEWK